MMSLRRLLFALGCAACCGVAAGADAPQKSSPALRGVWRGVVGDLPVVACFMGPEIRGSYYYERYRHLIPLSADAAPNSFAEDGGAWKLRPTPAGTLSGTWQGTVKGKPVRTLPIALSPLEGQGDDAACARDVYAKVFADRPAPVAGPRQKFGSHAYQTLSSDTDQSIRLLDDGPAIAAINAQLRKHVSTAGLSLADVRQWLAADGMLHVDEFSAKPVYWSSRFITVNFYDWAYGTGARGISSDDGTWNLESGKPVDLWSWVGGHDKGRGFGDLPGGLAKYLYRDVDRKVDEDCIREHGSEGAFRVALIKGGLQFAQWPSGSGCDQEFSATFAQLAPFLTAAGKDGAEAVRASEREGAVTIEP